MCKLDYDFGDCFENVCHNAKIYFTDEHKIMAIYRDECYEFDFNIVEMLDKKMYLFVKDNINALSEKFESNDLGLKRLKEVIEEYVDYRNDAIKNAFESIKICFNTYTSDTSNVYVDYSKVLTHNDLEDRIKNVLLSIIDSDIDEWIDDFFQILCVQTKC